jgi:hypothetical protein
MQFAFQVEKKEAHLFVRVPMCVKYASPKIGVGPSNE